MNIFLFERNTFSKDVNLHINEVSLIFLSLFHFFYQFTAFILFMPQNHENDPLMNIFYCKECIGIHIHQIYHINVLNVRHINFYSIFSCKNCIIFSIGAIFYSCASIKEDAQKVLSKDWCIFRFISIFVYRYVL